MWLRLVHFETVPIETCTSTRKVFSTLRLGLVCCVFKMCTANSRTGYAELELDVGVIIAKFGVTSIGRGKKLRRNGIMMNDGP